MVNKKGPQCHKNVLNEICSTSTRKGRCSKKGVLLAVFSTGFTFKWKITFHEKTLYVCLSYFDPQCWQRTDDCMKLIIRAGSLYCSVGITSQNANSCSMLPGGGNGLSLLALIYPEVSGAALIFTTVTEGRIRPPWIFTGLNQGIIHLRICMWLTSIPMGAVMGFIQLGVLSWEISK